MHKIEFVTQKENRAGINIRVLNSLVYSIMISYQAYLVILAYK